MEKVWNYQLEQQAAADDGCERALAHIPSSYGKLVYLASRRNPDTGRYEHFGLAQNPSNPDANRALRRSHESIFHTWMNYTLEQKKADVELYISAIDQVDRTELLDTWFRLTPYKNLVPASIQGPERHRHISDVEAILGLLRNVYGVSFPGQTS